MLLCFTTCLKFWWLKFAVASAPQRLQLRWPQRLCIWQGSTQTGMVPAPVQLATRFRFTLPFWMHRVR